ncbi:hypothetical protein MJO28_003582 [Puccinia striiformis f. sp. tritici]|uniref:Uncharacterized protein n=1 Tax=Puccinia striiformis f. sp. tritici TaxID=168172 RepID=A0ACC0EPZ1_9BASI|nr:hypothetical protein MJO28_003582 [Puccinia striiformis f. sp. tritici]
MAAPGQPRTESWDSDPDLILPDGSLSLSHSDNEQLELETSSASSVSALFSNSGNHSTYSVGIGEDDEQEEQQSIRNLHAKTSSKQSEQDEPDEDTKGGTLTLKTAHSKNTRLHSHQTEELGDSFSTSSSECQSTIKASFLPLPNNSESTHYHQPTRKSTTQIDRTVLAVLASGAKGTVTRLEPSKRPSPVQAGLDWDEDLVLPEGGLKTVFRPTNHLANGDVKKQTSFTSAISDELEDLNLANHPSSMASGSSSSSTHAHHRGTSSSAKSVKLCSTVNEEQDDDDDFGVDFELPPSRQSISLTDLNRKNPRRSNSKPASSVSLNGSEFEATEDDPFNGTKSTASSRRGSLILATLPTSSTNSISNNRASIDDTTPRIRTRPSLTPSLMSDRSSSSFPEIEDDINEGFFDDIEFPPEFGIPNNLAPAPTSSSHASVAPTAPSTTTPKPGQSALSDPKGKQPSRTRAIDLQSYLRTKVQARALLVERNTSSYLAQQLRQNISTFEDRHDERVEDGLEIETGSIHLEKLRSRKSSTISSASSHAQQSGRNSYFQQLHGQKSKPKRVTVPFPSSNSTTSSSSQLSEKHARFSHSRSPLNESPIDSSPRASPVPSASTSTLRGRTSTSNVSIINNRPNSTIPHNTSSSRLHAPIPHRPISAAGIAPGLKSAGYNDSLAHFRAKSLRTSSSNAEMSTDSSPAFQHSTRVQSPLGNPSRAARLVSKISAASSLRARVSTAAVTNGPPVLSASSQRTLKHKKSAAVLKSINLGSSGAQSHNSSTNDARSSLISPPGSNSSSSNGRGLQRKQSMPSLNRESRHGSGSEAPSSRFGGVAGMNAGSVWKSGGVPGPKTKQQPFDCTSTPSTPNLTSGPTLPSYADPTRSSMNRHVGGIGETNPVVPDRSSSVNSRRNSTENVRLNACSPTPTPTVGTPSGNSSRLTMPTIASRLKAKPSIIHEEHPASPNARRWTSNGISAVVPHQLRRPRRPRTYGDGTELDEFDDLPTSKEKEKLFTRAVKNTNPSNQTNSTRKLGLSTTTSTNHSSNVNEKIAPLAAGQRSRSRLEARKAEGSRRRTIAINAHIKKISTKKGLIRQMSGNTLSQLSTNSEMRWNDEEARWEGNEQVLREFDNVLSTSSRPALISQLSIQSPMMRSPTGMIAEDISDRGVMSSFKTNKAQNHVVGGMIFDAESMSWRKLNGNNAEGADEEDEDELHLESDEEFELKWLADDESSARHHQHPKTIGGVRQNESGWNSLSSSISHPATNPLSKYGSEDDGNSSNSFFHPSPTAALAALGNRNRGRRSGSFWLACLEAEERHKKEIKSWIPSDSSLDHHQHPNNNHQQSESSKPIIIKKINPSLIQSKKSNLSALSHTPSSTTSILLSSTSSKTSILSAASVVAGGAATISGGSTGNHIVGNLINCHSSSSSSSIKLPASDFVVVPGLLVSHGRLEDPDRCYLQEIRKLVLEEEF